ncbi:type I restriction endonuclease subunit R [Deinococcus sp. SDU3-2]|uniref:Type I restriction enzyme endonuclease subunit n=1 Tax=Deinococcus terrestris TaxID=2651870 RepID=A0A7X1TT55_9DEIO|nr:type I restriction endonuclease subunit R [Deinococcus terrestris]MPY68141.1 type I restriction endonuclease subunit R [Deinococcus terrestris]
MTEAELETQFVAKLQDLKYSYRPDIRTRAALEGNFRQKFDDLNRVTLTDGEFARLLEQVTTPDTFEASKTLRGRHTLLRDDGTPLDYTLVNVRDWCKNTFEVVNQLRMNTHSSHHRYDVLLLLNGVPVVQIELKKRDVSPQVAMRQIVDYKNDPGNGYGNSLLGFVQLFVVSNGGSTHYFANNRPAHFSFNADERYLPLYQWADQDNRKITDLNHFADAFLAKCTLAETVSRYMVLLETEGRLMMMRPYQIYAVKAIVGSIEQGAGNGYIWHTTGSGKTLTSFKASTLLKDNALIDKCIFVVDRKDLDRQTREEFNRFQPGSVEENANTGKLVRRLLSTDKADKVIVTTIQKLGLALSGGGKAEYQGQLDPLRDKRVVFIFDECHRSQFGENHQAIKSFFPNSQLFGFTGTPIFDENARSVQVRGKEASYQTTEDIFQRQLHAYTINHAIEDGNVLKFHVDYYKPEGEDAGKSQMGQGKAAPPPKPAVVAKILHKHDAATAGRRFNALLATASIDDAIAYYDLFTQVQAERQAEDPEFRPLNVTAVFSPPAYVSAEARQIGEDLAQERQDNQVNPEAKKQALERIIADYNARYGTNHSVTEFDAYAQDVQGRIKAQQWPARDVPHAQKLDLVIVVDMLLTGFDSKYLNTLYVDKNLRHHGLIQALSRTNRVLNATKPYGNILDFRGQQGAVDEAIAMFSSGGDAERSREIWLVEEAPAVIEKLQKAVEKVTRFMELHDLPPTPDQVHNLRGDTERVQFIKFFKDVQRYATQLEQYTDLTDGQRGQIAQILPPDDLQAFRGAYLETAQKLKAQQDKPGEPEEVDALDFELVLFASAIIDYDYIMTLLARSSAQETPEQQRQTRDKLLALIGSDAKFMDDRENLREYVQSLPTGVALTEAALWDGYEGFKAERHAAELHAVAETHGLDAQALQTFTATTLERLIFDSVALGELLTPLGLGWKARKRKEEYLMSDLTPLLRRRAEGREIAGLGAYEQ